MLYTYSALVTRIVDADTVLLDCDCGFSLWWRGMRLRLAHLNAPELATPEGKIARDYLASLLGPLPAPVTLVTIKDRTDNYGRYLGVLTTHTGVDVNQALLDSGHAVPWP